MSEHEADGDTTITQQPTVNHRTMDKTLKPLKPVRLDLDASSPNASKQWKHWRRTFENFLEEVTETSGRQPNKLVSHTVYEYIDELENYDECITKLEELHCKTPNEIFA